MLIYCVRWRVSNTPLNTWVLDIHKIYNYVFYHLFPLSGCHQTNMAPEQVQDSEFHIITVQIYQISNLSTKRQKTCIKTCTNTTMSDSEDFKENSSSIMNFPDNFAAKFAEFIRQSTQSTPTPRPPPPKPTTIPDNLGEIVVSTKLSGDNYPLWENPHQTSNWWKATILPHLVRFRTTTDH